MGEDGSQKFRSSKPHDPVRPSCSISTFSCLLAHTLAKSSCLYLCPLPLPLPSFYMLIPNRLDPYLQHVPTISQVVRRGRLRWYGHVEPKDPTDLVSACRSLVVEGVRGRGRGRKTWQECVQEDMKRLRLNKRDAQDRAA